MGGKHFSSGSLGVIVSGSVSPGYGGIRTIYRIPDLTALALQGISTWRTL